MQAPTYDELKNLCAQVNTLVTQTQILRNLFEQKPEKLDRFVAFYPRGHQLSSQGDYAFPAPRPEVILDNFIISNRRQASFIDLFRNIEDIGDRIEVAKNFFLENPDDIFTRLLYDTQIWKANFIDHQELSQRVQYYITVTTGLAKLFN